MKKKLALLLSLGLCVSTMTVTASAEEEKTYKIGVCQLMEHDALDATYNGFVEGLKEAGYEEGKNLEIDLLKGTAVAYVIGVVDVMGRADKIIAQHRGYGQIWILLAAALIYFVINVGIEVVFNGLTRYFRRHERGIV